eukprot:756959-Hanusia_phi.AAC.9
MATLIHLTEPKLIIEVAVFPSPCHAMALIALARRTGRQLERRICHTDGKCAASEGVSAPRIRRIRRMTLSCVGRWGCRAKIICVDTWLGTSTDLKSQRLPLKNGRIVRTPIALNPRRTPSSASF